MFQPLIASSIARVVSRYSPMNVALIDDLTQETFLRLCRENARLLREFDSRHENAIFGYIKVVATSVALDHFRARATQKRGAEVPAGEVQCEPQARSEAIEVKVLLGQIDSRLSATESERDRTIFWLYYRQGYTAREIAELPGVSLTQKGVESCIHRLTSLLRDRSDMLLWARPRAEGKPVRNPLGEMK
jgi:RNA polymerase sigma-70 factor (ECF subfamily)